MGDSTAMISELITMPRDQSAVPVAWSAAKFVLKYVPYTKVTTRVVNEELAQSYTHHAAMVLEVPRDGDCRDKGPRIQQRNLRRS